MTTNETPRRRGTALALVASDNAQTSFQALPEIERARFARQVACLRQPDRKVILLRYGIGCEQLSRREVARRLGMPTFCVLSIEQRALRSLRDGFFGPELKAAA